MTITSACVSFGSESLLSGSYALLLKGFDSAGNPALIGGVLSFNGTDNNGLITAGAIDTNLNSGVQLDLAVTSGSYGVGSDQRGCMVITTSARTQNYRFSLGNISGGVASTGHVIGFDQGGAVHYGHPVQAKRLVLELDAKWQLCLRRLVGLEQRCGRWKIRHCGRNQLRWQWGGDGRIRRFGREWNPRRESR